MLIRALLLVAVTLSLTSGCQRGIDCKIELQLFDTSVDGRVTPERDAASQVRDRLMSDGFWLGYFLPRLASKGLRPINGVAWRDQHISIAPPSEFPWPEKKSGICNFLVCFRGIGRDQAKIVLEAIAEAYETHGAERWRDFFIGHSDAVTYLEGQLHRIEAEMAPLTTNSPARPPEDQQRESAARLKKQIADAKAAAANPPPNPFYPFVKSITFPE